MVYDKIYRMVYILSERICKLLDLIYIGYCRKLGTDTRVPTRIILYYPNKIIKYDYMHYEYFTDTQYNRNRGAVISRDDIVIAFIKVYHVCAPYTFNR